jgi:hypothetical protein
MAMATKLIYNKNTVRFAGTVREGGPVIDKQE